MRFILIILILINILFANKNITTITLATEDWAPFSFKDPKTGQISGLSTQIIENTFKLMNVKIKDIKIYPWFRTQKMGYEGKFDAVYTASINKERKQYMLFPKEPIITSKWVLFSTRNKQNKLRFDNLRSLKNKKFCLIGGYNYPKEFITYVLKNAKYSYVATENLNLTKLLNGRCDYMPAVLETTLTKIKTNKKLRALSAYKKIFYFKKPLATTKFYLMFSKKRVDQTFVDKFSNTLKKFKTTKQYQKIVKHYL